MKREIWDIVAAKLSGEEISTEEESILNQWLHDASNQKAYNNAAETYEKTGLFFELKKIDTEKAWQKLNIAPKKQMKPARWLYRVAAVAAIMAIAFSAFWISTNERNNWDELATLQNDSIRPSITLSDGTTITLNHDSKLHYPKKFKGKERIVKLEGQAFFDVAPNKEMPFIIQTHHMNIRVLGTSFDVKAYEGSETVEVKVNTGKVELFCENQLAQAGERILILFPGEMGSFNRTSKQLTKHNQFDNNTISWYTRTLRFEATPLSEVVGILESTFNVQIFADKTIDLTRTISAKFEQQDLPYILDVVAITLGLKVDQTSNNEFVLTNNK
jgi:transmembrane sensor